jgi:MOSC domain-containing protein YiiM
MLKQQEKKLATVRSVNISQQRHGGKIPQSRILLEPEFGIKGDAHAGPGERQVSILAWEMVEKFNRQGFKARPGDFAENITTESLDTSSLEIGSNLTVGETLLKISGIGKPEWKPGDYSFKGKALLAEKGIFARVLQGGWIKPGDKITVVQQDKKTDTKG